jgi:hypothetical protein
MNNGYCHLTFQGPDFYCYVKEDSQEPIHLALQSCIGTQAEIQS